MATVHLPELVQGDRAVIDVVLEHPPGPLTWRPGAARYWQAEVAGEATLDSTEPVSRHARKVRLWATNTSRPMCHSRRAFNAILIDRELVSQGKDFQLHGVTRSEP